MNFLTLEVSNLKDFGGAVTLVGGALDGQRFFSGAAVFVLGHTVHFEERHKKKEPFEAPIVAGFWVLHRTILRGFPAVVCSYFNKRTQMIEQRYHKIFYKPGLYLCGPRFPKKVNIENQKDRFYKQTEKLAA